MAERGVVAEGENGTHDRVAIMSEVLRSFADATTDYALLLETIAKRTAEFLGQACIIRLVSEDGRSLEAVALWDPIEGKDTIFQTFNHTPMKLDERSHVYQSLESGRGLIIELMAVQSDITLVLDPAMQEAAIALDIRGSIIAPMKARGEVLGAIFVVRRGEASRAFVQEDLELAEGLATHAALAIANAKALRQLKVEIDERKKAESSLADAERARAQKKSIIDAVPHPLLVLTIDKHVTMANESFYQLFDTTERDAIGKHVDTIASGAFLSPEIRAIISATSEQHVLVTDRAVRLRDRTMLVNTRMIALPPNPKRPDNPHLPPTILLSLEDISERLDNAEKLRHRALILDAMREAVIAGDHEYRISEWNPAAASLFGVPAKEAVGSFVQDVLTTMANVNREDNRARLKSGLSINSQMRVKNRRGEWLDISYSSVPVSDTMGNQTGFVSVMQDISDRVRLEREVGLRISELERANRELEGFSYSVSHDLRAPIRAIQGFTRILKEDYQGALDAEGQRLLDVIGRNAFRMGRLIDDLLRFVRLGRQVVEASVLDMNSIVREAIERVRDDGPVPCTVSIEVADAMPRVYADRSLLIEAWHQLIANAVKFSSQNAEPRIQISSITTSDNETAYRIHDNGVGFDMRYAHKLFGVFERLHPTSDFEGTGVGLALAERIIDRHGGRIWAESVIGKSATFFFALPVEAKS